MTTGITHDALVYRSLEGFLATTVPFLREGIAAGEGTVVSTNERNTEALRRALGPDADEVMFAPASEVYRSPQAAIAAYDRAMELFLVQQGRPAARAIGEVAYGDSEGWLRYEPLAHSVFETTPLHVICPYDALALPGRLVEHALLTHEHIHDDGRRNPNDGFSPPDAVLASLPPFSAPPEDEPVLTLRVEHDTLSAARLSVGDLAAAYLEREQAEGAVIAIGELLANALMHGSGDAVIDLWADTAAVTVRVRNRGPRIDDPLAGFRRPRHPSQDGGMGLWLAGQLADEIGVAHSNGGPSVHLLFRR